MLKGKSLAILITTASLVVALIVAAIGVTFAWYSTHVAVDKDLEFSADGILIIYFDGEPNYAGQKLKPAVARKYDSTENVTDFGDVKTTGTHITTAASTVTVEVSLEYLNSTVDENEQSPTPTQIEANVVFDVAAKLSDGDAYEKNLNIPWDITIEVNSILVDYVYNTELVDVTYSEANGNAKDFGDVITVEGDCHVTANITIYFTQVDDLIDPDILRVIYDDETNLIIYINATIQGEE